MTLPLLTESWKHNLSVVIWWLPWIMSLAQLMWGVTAVGGLQCTVHQRVRFHLPQLHHTDGSNAEQCSHIHCCIPINILKTFLRWLQLIVDFWRCVDSACRRYMEPFTNQTNRVYGVVYAVVYAVITAVVYAAAVLCMNYVGKLTKCTVK